MYKEYEPLLLQIKTQRWYCETVLNKRNEYSDEAFKQKISDYFPNSDDHQTLLDLIYHALTPMYATSGILLDHTKKFDEINFPRFDDLKPMDQVLKAYDLAIERIILALKSSDLNTLDGELKEIRGNDSEFKRRFGIITMHALNHIAQALRIQGYICKELKQKDKESY